MPEIISHGWETDEPDDPTRDVSARNLNDHEISYTGLTSGHVLRASGATAAGFAALQDGDLPSTIARDAEVTAAIAALSSTYQPLDSDLTAIAALSTTAFGRSLLALADSAALLAEAGAAAQAHVHSGSDITTGTVADTRIASTIARDSEVDSEVAAGIADHVGEADPHPGIYLSASDVPGGQLGGTYATPTVDANHSGSSHSSIQAAAESTAASALSGHAADTTNIHGIADTADLVTTSDLGSYQPLDSDLTAIAALTTTSYGRAFLTLANAGAARTALGLGSAATSDTGDFDAAGAAAAAQAASQPVDSDLTAIAALTTTSFGRGLLALADAAALLSAAGAAASGHDHSATYQPLDSDLTAVAGLSPTNDDIVQRKSGAWTNRTIAQLLTDLAAAGTTFQPLDSDLTSIAALSTTSFGRGLLILADQAALLSAAGAAASGHNHTGTYQPLDSDLTSIAALTTTSFGRGLLELANQAALLSAAGASASSHGHTFNVALPFAIDGGGSVIATGRKVAIEVPFAGTITACRVFADASGSFTATIKKAAYSGLPTLTSIVASAKPTLSSAQKSEDTTLTGWTTSVSAGDWLELTVDTVTTCKQVTVSLTVSRTV